MFASDLHGALAHKATVKACLDFRENFKPEICVFGGDLFDLRALLRRATDEDRAQSIVEDVEAGMEFLRSYKCDVWLLGNHDYRIYALADSRDAVKAGLASKLIGEIESECASINTRMIPWGKRHGVYKMGHLTMAHGYASGVGAARKMALCYGNVLFGHNHSIDRVSIETHSHVMGHCVGALCELDLDYNLGQLGALRHAHGWAYGISDTKTGAFYTCQAQNIDGKWFLPSDFKL